MAAQSSHSKDELLTLLQTSGEETIAAIRALPPEAFTRICYEGGWNGREIVAHVAAIEWTYPRLIDLARQADADAQRADSGTAAPLSSGIDVYNARQVAKRADASLDELLDEFARNRAATIAAFAAVDDALLAAPIRTAGGISGRLGEVIRWVAVDHVRGHVYDIASAS
jgi:uncharacterized damage-inducible protein DinB